MEKAFTIDRPLDVWRVNAFTNTRFAGNPAGVVPAADGLSDAMMLAIAGELNDISETVFVSKPCVADADIRLRFFTTTTEVDLCGHATISALFVLAWCGRISALNDTKTIRAQTKAGVLELDLQFTGGIPRTASMQQPMAKLALAPGADRVPGILGLPRSALSERLRIGCAHTGLWACFVPLKAVSMLGNIRIQSDKIQTIWPDNPEFTGVYPFVQVDAITTQGRFFPPPRFGIAEDPVTGTAAGALGAFLMAARQLPEQGKLCARQGFEMGRGGTVTVCRSPNGKMKIQGQAVAVFRDELSP